MLQSSLWCQHKKSSRTDHKPKIFVTHKRKELYEQTQQIPQLVFRQNRLRAGCSRRFRRTWKYLAFSLPRSKIRRRNFPPHLYPAGAHLRLLHDRCRVRHRAHDTKKPGRRFPVVRQIEMAFRRGLDQRHYPDSDRSILLCHRRMGHQISDRIREGQQYPARRGRLFFRLHLKRSFHRALFCRFLPYYGRHHLRRCAKRH